MGVQRTTCWEAARVKVIVSTVSSRVVSRVLRVVSFFRETLKTFFYNKIFAVIIQKMYESKLHRG